MRKHFLKSFRLYTERFSWDAAGNQTDSPGQVVWHNLLQRLKGARWAFGGFGRMTLRKTGPEAVEQHYRYDDEHRIAEVRFTGHKEFSRAEYRYDALGRRTHKILYRHHKEQETISFLWSGLRMVGESRPLHARQKHAIYLQRRKLGAAGTGGQYR